MNLGGEPVYTCPYKEHFSSSQTEIVSVLHEDLFPACEFLVDGRPEGDSYVLGRVYR